MTIKTRLLTYFILAAGYGYLTVACYRGFDFGGLPAPVRLALAVVATYSVVSAIRIMHKALERE